MVVKRLGDGTRRVQQIGVLEGQPVTVRVVWDAETGPGPGYGELA